MLRGEEDAGYILVLHIFRFFRSKLDIVDKCCDVMCLNMLEHVRTSFRAGIFSDFDAVYLHLPMSSRRRSRSPRAVQAAQSPGQSAQVEQLKQLKLLHITKNAGTALEKLGKEMGLKWGKCWTEVKNHSGKLCEPHAGCMKSEWWHAPPCFFLNDPYKGYVPFAVVRCPYQRAISEFRCCWKGFGAPAKDEGKKTKRKNATADDLNTWLRDKLKKLASPYRNGHFIPQHFYIFDAHGQRYVPEDRCNKQQTESLTLKKMKW